MNNTRFCWEKGFTLWEILMALVLVGLLLGGVVSHYESSKTTNSEKVDLTNIILIQGAAQLYRLDTGVFPSSVEDLILNTKDFGNWRGPYLGQWPQNPYCPTKVYKINNFGKVEQG